MSICPVGDCHDQRLGSVDCLPEIQIIGAYATPAQTSIEKVADCCDIVLVHQRYLQTEYRFVSRLAEQQIPFIVIEASPAPDILARHLEAGASGYVTAEDSAESVAGVVLDVHTGNFRTDPYVTNAILRDFRRLKTNIAQPASDCSQFPRRLLRSSRYGNDRPDGRIDISHSRNAD